MLIPETTFSDIDLKSLHDFVIKTWMITKADLDKNHSVDLLFANTVEELGEYAAAKTVEKGVKNKELKESSLAESVDLIICSLSLFFANGVQLSNYMKLGKKS